MIWKVGTTVSILDKVNKSKRRHAKCEKTRRFNALSHWYVTIKDVNMFLCHLKLFKSKQHDCSIY